MTLLIGSMVRQSNSRDDCLPLLIVNLFVVVVEVFLRDLLVTMLTTIRFYLHVLWIVVFWEAS